MSPAGVDTFKEKGKEKRIRRQIARGKKRERKGATTNPNCWDETLFLKSRGKAMDGSKKSGKLEFADIYGKDSRDRRS
ncbi:hypothetical protein AgCh_032024 [Apium graveolens]